MLPPRHRVTRAEDFRLAVRRGRRGAGTSLVVHLLRAAGDPPRAGLSPAGLPRARPSRAGVVVPRAVGPAVTRNLVKRRLRHLLAQRLGSLPSGSLLVVRALAPAATASYADLDAELTKLLDRAGADVPPGGPRVGRS